MDKEKRELLNEAILGTKEIQSTVEKVAKLFLETKVNPRVDEAVRKIFEEEEEARPKAEEEEEEKVELDLDDVGKDIEEEVDDEPINIDKIREEEEVVEVKEKDEEEEEEEEEEEVPVSEELEEVYNKILKEVEVGKLPTDVTPIEKGTKPKEEEWHEAEKEGNKDYVMKESLTLRKLLSLHRETVKENKVLKTQLKKTVGQINEINLFNKKLLMSIQLFNEHNLTSKEQKAILADLDSAKTISEAKAIYRAYARSLVMSKGRFTESISRKIGMPNRTVLRENVNGRDENKDDNKRMLELANLNEDE